MSRRNRNPERRSKARLRQTPWSPQSPCVHPSAVAQPPEAGRVRSCILASRNAFSEARSALTSSGRMRSIRQGRRIVVGPPPSTSTSSNRVEISLPKWVMAMLGAKSRSLQRPANFSRKAAASDGHQATAHRPLTGVRQHQIPRTKRKPTRALVLSESRIQRHAARVCSGALAQLPPRTTRERQPGLYQAAPSAGARR